MDFITLYLPPSLKITNEQFFEMCQINELISFHTEWVSKGHYPSIYRDNDLNLLKANSLKPLLYPTRNSHLNLSYLVKPSYLFGSFFSFLSLGSFLGFLASLLPFFSLDISFTQLGLLVKAATFCY